MAVLLFSIAATQSVTVPIEMVRGVIVLHGSLDGVPLLLSFDPGATDFLTPSGKSRMNGRRPEELRIGAASAPAVMESSDDSSLPGIDGSVGPALLKRYAVTLRYAASTLTLTPLGAFTPPPNALKLPLTFDEYGLPVIAATIDGKPARFELDVRAPSSLLFTPFLKTSGIGKKYASAPIAKQSGTRVAHDIATISIAGQPVHHVTAWFSTDTSGKFASASVAGLLGNNFWSKFDLTLDYGAKAAYLILTGS